MKKLSCQEVLDQLEGFLDGDEDVRVQLKTEIEAHLHACSDCTIYVDSVRRTISLAKCDEPAIPLHLSSKLQAALVQLYRQDTAQEPE